MNLAKLNNQIMGNVGLYLRIIIGLLIFALAVGVVFIIIPALTRARGYSGPGISGNLMALEVAKARWWDAHKGGAEWPTKADLLPYLGSGKATTFEQAIRPRHEEVYIINETGAPVYAYFPKGPSAGRLISLDSNKLTMVEQMK